MEMRTGLRWFTWFIYRFNTPVMKHLFANPRNAWQVEQAVVSMLAGDVFDNPAVLEAKIHQLTLEFARRGGATLAVNAHFYARLQMPDLPPAAGHPRLGEGKRQENANGIERDEGGDAGAKHEN